MTVSERNRELERKENLFSQPGRRVVSDIVVNMLSLYANRSLEANWQSVTCISFAKGSNTDGSFTKAVSNSSLGKNPIAADLG